MWTRDVIAAKYSSRGSRSVRRPSPRSKRPSSIAASSPWISSSVRGAAPAWTIFTPLSETGLWLPVTVAPPSSPQCATAKYSSGVWFTPMSTTSTPVDRTPAANASFSAGDEVRLSMPRATARPPFLRTSVP